MGNSIYHSSVIYNRLIQLNLGQKPLILPVPAPAIAPPLPISLTMGSGMMQTWKLSLKRLLSKLFMGNPYVQASLCSALWMIPFLRKQSLRHELCIQLKMRISINLISNAGRITGIKQFPLCFPVMGLPLIMP